MKKLAIFDFDHTITKKDSFLQFIFFCHNKPKIILGFLLLSPILIAYKLGFVSNEIAKQKLFSFFFKGWEIKRFKQKCHEFNKRIDTNLRPKAMAQIANFRSKGVEQIIVSASIEDWINPWAIQNGFSKVIGTKLEISTDGILTGSFSTPNCHGMEKLKRVKEKYKDIDSYYVFMYGDSKGDKELLEFATEAHYRLF